MLGKEFQKTRLKAKMTQEQVAAHAKLSREYISQIENDRKSPTIDVYMRMCNAVGVRPSKLMSKFDT